MIGRFYDSLCYLEGAPVFLKMIENYPFEFVLFPCSRASDFGLMKIDNRGRVISFSEKPKGEDLRAMVMCLFFFFFFFHFCCF